MEMGFYLGIEQRCYLNPEQRLALQNLFLLEQTLRDPELAKASTGLYALVTAHKLLQDRNSIGVLIGGLAETVWNRRRKPEELEKHKDVDVMVFNNDFYLNEDFEEGIDWWLPYNDRLTIRTLHGTLENVEKRWWKNGYNVVLSFGIEKKFEVELNPGLYIPGSEWVVDMREYEAHANVDYERISVEFDDDVFEKFRQHIKKRVKTRLPGFIEKTFTDYILSPIYERDSDKAFVFKIDIFDINTIRAIKKLENIVSEIEITTQ